ncbi:FAD-dependent monooxygenase [Actinoplanes sp. KI2]|uniref:FAD-dependent monooxygenase n=1 Tax=Actinoplanes sp. KI2 TaxID=2983315 RepID=UPI0021D61089|nr:FAD-dependent monooxygenase [Actinoplanes sp. KI2]MCU7729024.1 FAD-dependent monooxygenase [Actinoplanes sp. KI2]
MTYDVVVAGAGPVGLMVAGELALRGVRVLAVERLAEPDLTIKAGAINVPTAEALDRRGLLPQLRAAQEAVLELMGFAGRQLPRPAGHFGGIWLSSDDLDPSFAADRGPAAQVAMLSQAEIERILAEHATARGAAIRRGTALTGFTQNPDRVRVELGDETIECGWLVGCDGGRSLVRKLAGFDFPGTDPIITGHQAIVEMSGAESLRRGWNVTGTGVYVHGPIPGRVLTVEFDGPPIDRDAPITAAELQASIRHTSGVDVTVQRVLSATRFTDNARQATTYRAGRVLLAGDAAHVHSPFGGQGLNLGIGDAMNLGWKLAAEIQGWAPAGLLDSYTTERHPIGAWVLDWTRAQIAIMKPEPYARALRGVLADLAGTEDGATYLAASVAGLRQRYDLGGEDPRVGRSAPEIVLADGSRLADHLHGGAGVLIGTGQLSAGQLSAGQLEVVAGDVPGMLVRPDGIVAWVEGDGDLGEALRRWFGSTVVETVAV